MDFVATTAPVSERVAVLRTFLAQDEARLSPSLHGFVERELRVTTDIAPSLHKPESSRTGPIQAILLDPLLPGLEADDLRERVRKILAATKPPSRVQTWALPLISLCGLVGFVVLLQARVVELWAYIAVAAMVSTIAIPARRSVHIGLDSVRGQLRIFVPVRYPAILFDDAIEIALLAGRYAPAIGKSVDDVRRALDISSPDETYRHAGFALPEPRKRRRRLRLLPGGRATGSSE